jgi:hypothetical protein
MFSTKKNKSLSDKVIALILVALAYSIPAANAQRNSVTTIPSPTHVVIVVEENKAYRQIIGNMAAQFVNQLANEGASFSQSFAVAHPSQPNYLALFSGSTHGVTDDRCPLELSGENLSSELRRKGKSFAIFSESMPSVGYAGCVYGAYARKHNPAVNWQYANVPRESNLPLSMLPADYARLPTVSIIVPNQLNDMHDGQPPDTIIRADRWLRTNLESYVRWAKKNNSLLIVTWDEDDDSSNNQIATIFVGPMVKPGVYRKRINHYNVLRTIVEMYGLGQLGNTLRADPITDIWIQKNQ